MFLSSIRDFLKTEIVFFKNISLVFGGKVYVSALSLIVTPLVARLFTPTAYGEFALYNTAVQNMIVIGTLSFPMAISTVNKKEINNTYNGALNVVLYSIIFLSTGIFVLRDTLDLYFKTSVFSQYWYMILISYVLFAFVSVIAALNIRLKRFGQNIKVNMIEATSAKLINVTGGLAGLSSIGLILSDTISRGISLFILIRTFPKNIQLNFLSFPKLKEFIGKNKDFPLYIMPTQWLGTLSNQFIIIIVAYQFKASELGQLTMALGLISIPINVLSNSFQPVITERFVSLKEDSQQTQFFDRLLIIITVLGAITFFVVFILPQSFFTLFLGNQWHGVNAIINIYCAYYVVLLVDRAFQIGFVIFNKRKVNLLFNLTDLILLSITGYFCILYQISFLNTIGLVVTIKSIISIYRIYYLRKISKLFI